MLAWTITLLWYKKQPHLQYGITSTLPLKTRCIWHNFDSDNYHNSDNHLNTDIHSYTDNHPNSDNHPHCDNHSNSHNYSNCANYPNSDNHHNSENHHDSDNHPNTHNLPDWQLLHSDTEHNLANAVIPFTLTAQMECIQCNMIFGDELDFVMFIA